MWREKSFWHPRVFSPYFTPTEGIYLKLYCWESRRQTEKQTTTYGIGRNWPTRLKKSNKCQLAPVKKLITTHTGKQSIREDRHERKSLGLQHSFRREKDHAGYPNQGQKAHHWTCRKELRGEVHPSGCQIQRRPLLHRRIQGSLRSRRRSTWMDKWNPRGIYWASQEHSHSSMQNPAFRHQPMEHGILHVQQRKIWTMFFLHRRLVRHSGGGFRYWRRLPRALRDRAANKHHREISWQKITTPHGT